MHHPIRYRWTGFRAPGIAALLGACLFLAGCQRAPTQSDPAASGSAQISACGLLTQAEVAAIFGKAVVSMKEDTGKGTASYITTCVYKAALDSDAVLPTRLSVTAYVTAGLQPIYHLTVPAYFANLKTTLSSGSWEPVAGVGADALWQKYAGRLSMYKADTYADIIYSVYGAALDSSAAAKAGCIAAGMKVAEKI